MTKGQKIKKAREALDYSQVYVAGKINVSKQTYFKYENDIITNIPSDKLELLASVLCVSPSYIMGWEETNNIEKPETLAAHLEGENFTDDEMKEILNFVEFIKGKRRD